MNGESTIDFEKFTKQVNLIGVLDHSGRGGNGFFQTIFDKHTQILTCPWMHYTYSYFVSGLGNQNVVDSKLAHEHLIKNYHYFGYIYSDLNEGDRKAVIKFGGDPSAAIDREKVRLHFDRIVLQHKTITRKEAILAMYYSFAKGIGKNIEDLKYVMVTDAISLRHEKLFDCFSAEILDLMVEDFEVPRLVSLIRDPRAVFASNRHQFVNQNGNIYGLKPGNFLKSIKDMVFLNWTMESCAYTFWLTYCATAYKTITNKKKQYGDFFLTIRNEDLNLNFEATLESLAKHYEINPLPEWNQDFVPTMLSKPWHGTGAYNDRYQPINYGALQNDSKEESARAVGPNSLVTQRWRKRLSSGEVKLLELLFGDELEYASYPFIQLRDRNFSVWSFFSSLLLPFKGELPSLDWLLRSYRAGPKEFMNVLFYTLCFPLFYVLGRLSFLYVVVFKKHFKLGEVDVEGPICVSPNYVL